MEQWTYSHTQLAMWRKCQRKYHDAYILGFKEPKTPAMAFGTLVHNAVEAWLVDSPPQWEAYWAEFLASFGGTNDYDDPVYNLKVAKRCFELYKGNPVEGAICNVEQRNYYEFPDGIRYVSIPDFVVERPILVPGMTDGLESMRKRFTVDFKTTSAWKVNALLPYDDQFVGQAVCTGADGFARVTFKIDKKTARPSDPIIEEHLLDPVLRDEWIEETWATCREIEHWKQKTFATWPKNSANCFGYGRACHRLSDCKNGFTVRGS